MSSDEIMRRLVADFFKPARLDRIESLKTAAGTANMTHIMAKYSNPRTQATIENWPSGSKRVTAVFTIETDPRRGERAVRVTTGAPKKLTYAAKMRIVDGADGRTYIAALSGYGHITIWQSNMKFNEEHFFDRDSHYADLCRALFDV